MDIEPWHALGEEMSEGVGARYVDSSPERVQVCLTGATGDRYARRGARFTPFGHSAGPIDPSAWQPASVESGDTEYPRTLDLPRHAVG